VPFPLAFLYGKNKRKKKKSFCGKARGVSEGAFWDLDLLSVSALLARKRGGVSIGQGRGEEGRALF
jgi:hypothetical protein